MPSSVLQENSYIWSDVHQTLSAIKETTQPNRFIELDYLRGLAALAVLLFHFTYGYDNRLKTFSIDKFYFRHGDLAVNLFFMISGYVIFMTLNRTRRGMDFIVSRVIRLYPAYWVAIVFSMIFVKIFRQPFGFENVSFYKFFVNLTMLQHWFKVRHIDSAFWTLTVELSFYAIMFVLYMAKQLRYINTYCLLWLVLSFLSVILVLPLENYFEDVLILRYVPYFIAGIAFFKIRTQGINTFSMILLSTSLVIALILTYQATRTLVPIIITCSFYLIFFSLALNKLHFGNSRALAFFGTISYSLYLIHENVGQTLIYNLKKFINSQWFYVPVTSLIVIGLATVMTYYLERPLMKRMKQRYLDYKAASERAYPILEPFTNSNDYAGRGEVKSER